MRSPPILQLPRRPWLLIIGLLVLGVTKSKRCLNLVFSDMILFDADYEAGAMIGSALFSVYTLPLALILWATVFRKYPNRTIGLFELPLQGGFKIVFVHICCALLIVINLSFLSSEWRCANAWLVADDKEGILAMFGGLSSSLGTIVLWLCIRAIVTAKANDRLAIKSLGLEPQLSR